MRIWATIFALLLVPRGLLASAPAADPASAQLERGFSGAVHPFVQTYCITCHGKLKSKGDLDLSAYQTTAAVAGDFKRWQLVLEKLQAGEMPPKKAKKHPTDKERIEIVAWISGMRRHEALRNAGDPGIVLARRLSNAEYDYTIRDLTGVDIQPTKTFPVDPANEAGFDNSGESLTMSPSLLKKYMEAARLVSDYLVLKPDGLAFAPYPIVSETDRDKYCVNRIIAFYKRQPTDLADYFQAAWLYENRAALGKPNATLDDFASRRKVSPKYLHTVYASLTGNAEKLGPIAALQAMWRALPAPARDPQNAPLREKCAKMRDVVVALRAKVRPQFSNLRLRGLQAGSQPLVLWKDRQYATTRLAYAPGSSLQLQPEDLAPGTAAAPALAIPTDKEHREQYEDSFKRFSAVYPDTFVVTERARIYLKDKEEKLLVGRLLSAGFHSQMGYFRDDAPLYDMVLSSADQQELDTLWRELDFIADVPRRTLQGMMWFERSDSSFMRSSDFDFVRAEERDIVSEPKLKRLGDAFLAKAHRNDADATGLGALTDYFDGMNAASRLIDRERIACEPTHLAALQEIAQRAYRRPLSNAEKDDIVSFYRSLRSDDHLDHEEAVHDTLVSILMSPYFCYRVNATPSDGGVHPLSDYELASRLSYFLWSSMPDHELLDHAAAGDLHKPNVLLAQTRRLMHDDRIRGLATEFAGNWLDFRRFQEYNGVDRERFKSFDNNLRQAMFEEPIRFFMNLAGSDGSVLDFLYGDYTFVNPALARHYGMPVPAGAGDQWVRVDHARQYQRGGLLPMAVFLTKNSPGLRTSPVKRGNWVVKRILGEVIAPPPPNVPALPPDESKLGDLTLPQVLARHRQDKTCATCHEHFDSVGLAFEGYGPVGGLRTLDLGGKPVENHATFRDGSTGTGLQGLLTYIRARRQDDFLDNLCRKLLADALGRTLTLSDDPAIEQMRASLIAEHYRFGALVETIVTSPQFLNKRGQRVLAKG
ncbi:MAG TPA: DUF1592 domain-containing protein [Tepidisphaeraceae bacterium]|nr:DUF1592 domain-containing protein [Tepidisphaeraceae bacterium]